jgi:hypothetical protein
MFTSSSRVGSLTRRSSIICKKYREEVSATHFYWGFDKHVALTGQRSERTLCSISRAFPRHISHQVKSVSRRYAGVGNFGFTFCQGVKEIISVYIEKKALGR